MESPIQERIDTPTLERLSFTAVEQTADSVIITDRKGIIIYVNPAFERTTGYAKHEVIGRAPGIIKSGRHEPAFYQTMWDMLLAGNVFRATIINRTKQGKLYYAEQSITPMKDGSGIITHFVSVGKDITVLRRAEKREIEMQAARRVQQQLYPGYAPSIQGIDIAGASYPATALCGDYYDFVVMGRDRINITIGDVTGHGFGPALVMVQTRTSLRLHMEYVTDLGEIAGRLNTSLRDDLALHHFVTLLLTSYDLKSKELTYINAGHPPGYILDRSGNIIHRLESSSVPLGILAEPLLLSQSSVPLEPGSSLVMLTDGFDEIVAPDGTRFGTEHALDVIAANLHKPAKSVLRQLRRQTQMFLQRAPQHDDVTAVICKIND